ncbi:MAG: DUF4111 domain-containing protein [Clostridiales bacterium]|nr:DUF4111 domain-containing protein [Clostridiales bacterium]
MNGRINEKYRSLLDSFTAAARECFGEMLTGVYLHGSMVMGCFRPEISDIDLLVVVDGEVADNLKLRFMERVVELNSIAPAKGLEMSVIARSACDPFLYPTPFLLHFSPMHLNWFRSDPKSYAKNMKGDDRDLAAHAMILRRYGITLSGEPIHQVFGEVSNADYLDSILYDVEEACETMDEFPVSTILNLCRVLAFVREERCLSKAGGGQWALKALQMDTAHRILIEEALECYTSGKTMPAPGKKGAAFAKEMLRLIHQWAPLSK